MKEKLFETASALNQPPASSAREFLQKHGQFAELGNQTMAGRTDMDKLVGKDNRKMAEDNNRNFARFMASLFENYDPKVLVETVLWVFRAYRSHGFQITYWSANLSLWADMIRQELSEESCESVYPFYNWLIVNIPIFVKLSDDHLSGSTEESKPAY
jgi:hypothetical protein